MVKRINLTLLFSTINKCFAVSTEEKEKLKGKIKLGDELFIG